MATVTLVNMLYTYLHRRVTGNNPNTGHTYLRTWPGPVVYTAVVHTIVCMSDKLSTFQASIYQSKRKVQHDDLEDQLLYSKPNNL